VSYLAIARKYRPTTFDEMVGQPHVTATLRNAIARHRIHHAWLFCGARGVGKTTAARALARALNCAQGPTAQPCGVCPSCIDILAGNSPDLLEIDGASNNSVDDVRELRESVRYLPTQGRYRIYLIDEVHMLSTAAFNALLKTLEEPPPHVVFLFATTEADKVPETILSRVQRFDFRRIAATDVAGRLAEIASSEGARVTDGALRLIARAGEGSMRDAQSLLDKVLSFGGGEVDEAAVTEMLGLVDRRLLFRMLEGLLGGQIAPCLSVVATVHDHGFELSRFLAELLDLLRDATFLHLSPDVETYVELPHEEKQALKDLASSTPSDLLPRLFQALLDVHEQVARASRPRVVREMSLVRLVQLRALQPVGALVAQLDALDRRLRAAGGAAPMGGAGTTPRRNSGPGARAERAGTTAATPRTTSLPQAQERTKVAATDPRAIASANRPEDAWKGWQEAVLGLRAEEARVFDGPVRFEATGPVLRVAPGRPFATARRLLALPDIAAQTRAWFGPRAEVRLEEALGSRSDAPGASLERDAITDPAIAAMMALWDARLSAVVADTDGAS
jgi:DNA polymerase-3 subunit gamma/tau